LSRAGYWKKLELFTSKIRTLKFDLICPRFARASVSATLMRSKIEKFSTFIFFARNFLFFLIKEKKIFLFCVPAVAGKRKRSRSPQTEGAGKNFPPQTSPIFARLLGLRPQIFLAAGL